MNSSSGTENLLTKAVQEEYSNLKTSLKDKRRNPPANRKFSFTPSRASSPKGNNSRNSIFSHNSLRANDSSVQNVPPKKSRNSDQDFSKFNKKMVQTSSSHSSNPKEPIRLQNFGNELDITNFCESTCCAIHLHNFVRHPSLERGFLFS